ncbi:phosphatidate cytidylyltransferase [Kordiimonas sp. SCSIO 12610]|uniref:phosphatidate cytidylyltransferase n=1 Tax=Kordiimonas sp. SCSIO 12610 TaxID=2829597 RepID=UPI00210E65F7|nr:phosphatidate cytidylyltransferase [Kordiimonas sp. SCSIO 12610]UTW54051.1 phosphatidate cytidylyltransferase [Kordiimonas sp. SCSIO 12610]
MISKNLLQRIISALMLLPPVVGAIYLGGWWFYGLLLLGGILMMLEWNRMVSSQNPLVDVITLLPVALLPMIFVLLPQSEAILSNPMIMIIVLALVLGVGTFIEISKTKSEKHKTVYYSLLGSAYVSSALIALSWLRSVDEYGLMVLWIFLNVWAMDVGGYFAGKGIGGPKLSPKISPNKTWAGLIGGIVLAMIISYLFSLIFTWGDIGKTWVMGGVVALVAQMGDLYESAVKRRFDVKDSGELIPGHGGILDRVDGIVSAAPFTALVLALYFALG